jgi:hypothetical protein
MVHDGAVTLRGALPGLKISYSEYRWRWLAKCDALYRDMDDVDETGKEDEEGGEDGFNL